MRQGGGVFVGGWHFVRLELLNIALSPQHPGQSWNFEYWGPE